MIIDFSKIKEERIPNFKGGEKETVVRAFSDESNRIMYDRLLPGASIGMHTHDTNSEIIYVLRGKGKFLTPNGEERISAGECHYCPKGHTHSFVNDSDEDLVFFAVVAQQ